MITTTSTTTIATHPGQRFHSTHDRRDAALAHLAGHRSQIQQVIDAYRDRGVAPGEMPGLRRMLAGARQAQLVLRTIDLELAGR